MNNMNRNYIFTVVILAVTLCRPIIAALPDSCQEGDTAACETNANGVINCPPRGTTTTPPKAGKAWYSQCCTVSEDSETKEYCYMYTLQGYASNLHFGIKPTCSEGGSGSLAWNLEGQCQIGTSGSENFPYVDLDLDPGGCPAQWDASSAYQNGDKVELNQAIFTCSGGTFCNSYQPDLFGYGLAYWVPTNSCDGTIEPTQSPNFSTTATGCPEEYNPGTVYEEGDKISIKLQDGRSTIYTCRSFPASSWCNVQTYSPLNTATSCNGGVCWPTAWTYGGGCEGTYSPSKAPVFGNLPLPGCPDEFSAGTLYEEGDLVSITSGTQGKIYKCKEWPYYGYCKLEAYKPGSNGQLFGGEPLWKQAWSYVQGCEGTSTPTTSPMWSGTLPGCAEEYSSSTTYAEGDKVSITTSGSIGKNYICKEWPFSGYCNLEAYKPGSEGTLPNGDPLWQQAWTFDEGCDGTGSPTASPQFDPSVGGCPVAYVAGTEYEAGERVSISVGDDLGKIYECRGWPQTGFCRLETYKPGPGGELYLGEPLWKEAWTFIAGCSGTITPTAAPMFVTLPKWNLEGCPPTYIPNNPNYVAGAVVSVSTNDDNTYGVVWRCRNAQTWPWCQQDGYAPGSALGGNAWERLGFCEGTISPTTSPVEFGGACQFKYELSSNGEFVVLPAESWQFGGTTVSTVSGGAPLILFDTGHLVRSGAEAYECNAWPFNPFCNQFSPFIQDSTYFNSINSPQGWRSASCGNVDTDLDDADDKDDEFNSGNGGPVFASDGKVLVDETGACQYYDGTGSPADSGATNAADFFKPSPAVRGCQQCDTGEGFGDTRSDASSHHPDLCTTCLPNTASNIVDGRSKCVCDNGATDPWGGDTEESTSDQCETCPGGQKYLGIVDESGGFGKCVSSCPTDYPHYTNVVDNSDMKNYKVCCSTQGCPEGRSGCFDGGATSGTLSEAVCIHASETPSTAPSEEPSSIPSATPSEDPSSVPSVSLKPTVPPPLG